MDLAHTYVIRAQYETYLPEWQNYNVDVSLMNLDTDKPVELRYSDRNDRWYFEFPSRGRYKITLTITSTAGETKTVEKLLNITPPDYVPVYYKLDERDAGFIANPKGASNFYLQFYSDKECTQRINYTTATIECRYILWDHYYDRHFQLASSTKQYEGTFLVPVGSSEYKLPHTIMNATTYGLDQHIFEYEIVSLRYK